MSKEQSFPNLLTIIDLKLAHELPEEKRPGFRITVKNAEGDFAEVISDLKLTGYEEHYMNGLEKIVFTLSHDDREAEEYEWLPRSSSEKSASVVTNIAIHWQGDKPRLSEEKIKRFLMLLPSTYDREEVNSVAQTMLGNKD